MNEWVVKCDEPPRWFELRRLLIDETDVDFINFMENFTFYRSPTEEGGMQSQNDVPVKSNQTNEKLLFFDTISYILVYRQLASAQAKNQTI